MFGCGINFQKNPTKRLLARDVKVFKWREFSDKGFLASVYESVS